jgi:tRNA-(ms[2]io[6]A)-hydroxylase
MFELKHHTGQDWVDAVLADFDRFLQDHAAAEKKSVRHGHGYVVSLS